MIQFSKKAESHTINTHLSEEVNFHGMSLFYLIFLCLFMCFIYLFCCWLKSFHVFQSDGSFFNGCVDLGVIINFLDLPFNIVLQQYTIHRTQTYLLVLSVLAGFWPRNPGLWHADAYPTSHLICRMTNKNIFKKTPHIPKEIPKNQTAVLYC